jgi:hypothetical protein
VQGHEIKVYQVGPGVWFQKGLSIAEAPKSLHIRELADAGLTDKPVKIYGDYTRLAPVKHHKARQRNLKSPARDLAINPKLEAIMPQYRLPLIGMGAGQSQEDKDRITAMAGVTPELEAWLKTVGK